DLQHALLVAHHCGRGAVDNLELVSTAQRYRAELVRERLREDAEIDRLDLDVDPPRVDAREVEQVGGELRQPVDLLAHRLEKFTLGVRVELFVLEQLEEASEREERRPQLVRRVRDELPARVFEPG